MDYGLTKVHAYHMVSFITKNCSYQENANICLAPAVQTENIFCSQTSKTGYMPVVSHGQLSDSFQDRDECALG